MTASVSTSYSSKFCYLQLREDDFYIYRISKSLIKAAYYFEIISPIYKRNQHFMSFKMLYNIKFCPIP